MSANATENGADVIWIIKPWITPSLVEETVMVVITFILSYLVELYFGTTYTPMLGTNLITLTGLGLSTIWIVNAFHLLLVRSTSRYTLRRSGLEIQTGIFNRKTVLVSPSNFFGVYVIQSIMGKIMDSGEMYILIRGDHRGEGKMRRVRYPFVVEKEIRKIMSIV